MHFRYFTSKTAGVSPIKNPLKASSDASGFSIDTDLCSCGKGAWGDMVKCVNIDCKYVHFHYECVGIKQRPRKADSWYCPECKKLPQFKKPAPVKKPAAKKPAAKKPAAQKPAPKKPSANK